MGLSLPLAETHYCDKEGGCYICDRLLCAGKGERMMPDVDKVIKGLEICGHGVISQENCMECPYIYDGRSKQSNCEGVLHYDAIALLKEQEAVKIEV